MLIRKLFKAEMAHMVPGAYTERCHYLHGHSYKFELFLRSSKPNASMMVEDFKAVKEIGLRDFFDSFDHAVMVWSKDPVAKLVGRINPERHLIVPFIPTAEMIAKACFVVSRAIVQTARLKGKPLGADVDRVVVHETDTGAAAFGVEDLTPDEFPDIQFNRWVVSAGIRREWENKTWFRKMGAGSF